MITLVESAARASSSNSGALHISQLDSVKAAIFFLDVTAAAQLVGDTLNVYIQSSMDGQIWDDFVSFTQVLGNGGAKQYTARWFRDLSPEAELEAPSDKAMAAGIRQGHVPCGYWRVAWVIAGGENKSFTFSVSAELFRK
jgi:hypothetical protein